MNFHILVSDDSDGNKAYLTFCCNCIYSVRIGPITHFE